MQFLLFPEFSKICTVDKLKKELFWEKIKIEKNIHLSLSQTSPIFLLLQYKSLKTLWEFSCISIKFEMLLLSANSVHLEVWNLLFEKR